MRKNYIDNLRIICILLLFPFHAAMCFNAFGENFYIIGTPNQALSQIVVVLYPWWMSLLFALAGLSSFYALRRRSAKEYAKERVLRLLVPLIAGILIIVPPQAYMADVYHNAYSGGYFAHYVKFFTNITDLYGSDGCFSPAHLWFVLYLFVISLVCLPLMTRYLKREKQFDFSKVNLLVLFAVCWVLLCLSSFILDIGGKSLGDFCFCFLIGFFLFSSDDIMARLEKHRIVFGLAWVGLMLIRSLCVIFNLLPDSHIVWDIEYKLLELTGMFAALGLGSRFLNFSGRFTRYFSRAAFPLYYLHQTVLIAVAFLVCRYIPSVGLQYTVITLGSFILTVAAYELFRRFALTCFLFGIKSPR